MKYDIDLFIPDVKVYGFVFMVDDEPILFIIDDDTVLDGIPIYGDFDDEEEDEEQDIYTLLDADETILVGVEVLDDDFNEINVKDITDDNCDEFIYNLLPLKLHTLNYDDLSMEDIMETNKLKDVLFDVVNNYKIVLEKSKL